jgi:hypothetical protein
MSEEFIPLEREMLDDSVVIVFFVGYILQKQTLLHVLAHQVSDRKLVVLNCFCIVSNRPLSERLLHVCLDVLHPIVAKIEPVS